MVRHILGVLTVGIVATGALWVVHLQTSGLVWMLSTVGSLAAAAVTVALAIWLTIDGLSDARSEARAMHRLRSRGSEIESTTDRCPGCRRRLVLVNGLSLCLTCDQRPAL